MEVILFLIASLLKWILSPLLYWYGIIRSLQLKEFLKWHKDLAISKDQYGNVVGKYFWNDYLIKSYSKYKFGHPDETISSVEGKNKLNNTLTSLGKWLADFLNKREKNHVEKAIEK